jgi:hypothetical protein
VHDCDCGWWTTSVPQLDGVTPIGTPMLGAGANTGSSHAAYYSRPGLGSFFYQYHTPQGGQMPYMEVRSVDGTITRYEAYGAFDGKKQYRPVDEVDPYDNETEYVYQNDRLVRVRHPSGIDEVWNYAPSWIGGENGWDGELFSGVEVTFVDTATPPADLSHK